MISIVVGRRNGKSRIMNKMLDSLILNGERPAIATRDGIFCYNCKLKWEICEGTC